MRRCMPLCIDVSVVASSFLHFTGIDAILRACKNTHVGIFTIFRRKYTLKINLDLIYLNNIYLSDLL